MTAPIPPRRIIPRERLDLVERMWLTGATERKIQETVVEKWGVSRRTSLRYIARVRTKLAALPSAQPEAIRARSEAMLLETFALARESIKVVVWKENGSEESRIIAAPEVGTMASISYRLSELHGADAPKRMDHTSGGKPLASVVLMPALEADGRRDTDSADD